MTRSDLKSTTRSARSARSDSSLTCPGIRVEFAQSRLSWTRGTGRCWSLRDVSEWSRSSAAARSKKLRQRLMGNSAGSVGGGPLSRLEVEILGPRREPVAFLGFVSRCPRPLGSLPVFRLVGGRAGHFRGTTATRGRRRGRTVRYSFTRSRRGRAGRLWTHTRCGRTERPLISGRSTMAGVARRRGRTTRTGRRGTPRRTELRVAGAPSISAAVRRPVRMRLQ